LMNRTTVTMVALLVAVLFAGIVFSCSHGAWGSSGNHTGFFGKSNMTFNGTRMDIREKINLSENATFAEIRDAVREQQNAERNQLLQAVRQKLDLPSNATNDEINTALDNWAEQNKDLLQALEYGRMGARGFPTMKHREYPGGMR